MSLDATRLAAAINPDLASGLEAAIRAVFTIVPGPGDIIIQKFCQAFADGTAPTLATKIVSEITTNAEVKQGTLPTPGLVIDTTKIIAPAAGGPCSTAVGGVTITGSGKVT